MDAINERNTKYRTLADFDTTVRPVADTVEEIDWPRFINAYADWVAHAQPHAGNAEQVKQKVESSRKLVFDHWQQTYQKHREQTAHLRYFHAEELRRTAGNVGAPEGLLQYVSTFPYLNYAEVHMPVYVGEFIGRIDHFRYCLHEFLQAEKSPVSTSLTPEQEADEILSNPVPPSVWEWDPFMSGTLNSLLAAWTSKGLPPGMEDLMKAVKKRQLKDAATPLPPAAIPKPARPFPLLDEPFAIAYRRALRELNEAHRYQSDSIPASLEADLLLLSHQQEQTIEAAIHANRENGRGLLIKSLREAIEAQSDAWTTTQHIRTEIESMQEAGYDYVIDNDLNRAVYYVIEDAIGSLLALFGTYFPAELTTTAISTWKKAYPLPELVEQYGPHHLKRVVRQRTNQPQATPASEVIEVEKQTAATPDSLYAWDEIEKIAGKIKLRFKGRFLLAPKWIGQAGAGFIDGLKAAGILPKDAKLKDLHAAFSDHYQCPIESDRDTDTRRNWRNKTLKELGLSHLNPRI